MGIFKSQVVIVVNKNIRPSCLHSVKTKGTRTQIIEFKDKNTNIANDFTYELLTYPT